MQPRVLAWTVLGNMQAIDHSDDNSCVAVVDLEAARPGLDRTDDLLSLEADGIRIELRSSPTLQMDGATPERSTARLVEKEVEADRRSHRVRELDSQIESRRPKMLKPKRPVVPMVDTDRQVLGSRPRRERESAVPPGGDRQELPHPRGSGPVRILAVDEADQDRW